jgi:hypothetical protein
MLRTNASKDFLVKGEGYILRVEYNKDFVIFHIREIDKFTKEVFIAMKYQLEDWYEFVSTMCHEYIWAAVPKTNLKIQRLLTGLNFKYVGQYENLVVCRYGD